MKDPGSYANPINSSFQTFRTTSTDNPCSLTVERLDYLDYLNHPTKRWLERNWFPVTVAAITVAVSVAGIGVNMAVNLGG